MGPPGHHSQGMVLRNTLKGLDLVTVDLSLGIAALTHLQKVLFEAEDAPSSDRRFLISIHCLWIAHPFATFHGYFVDYEHPSVLARIDALLHFALPARGAALLSHASTRRARHFAR